MHEWSRLTSKTAALSSKVSSAVLEKPQNGGGIRKRIACDSGAHNSDCPCCSMAWIRWECPLGNGGITLIEIERSSYTLGLLC